MLVASYWEFADQDRCIDVTSSGRSASGSERPLMAVIGPSEHPISTGPSALRKGGHSRHGLRRPLPTDSTHRITSIERRVSAEELLSEPDQ